MNLLEPLPISGVPFECRPGNEFKIAVDIEVFGVDTLEVILRYMQDEWCLVSGSEKERVESPRSGAVLQRKWTLKAHELIGSESRIGVCAKADGIKRLVEVTVRVVR